MIGTVRQLGGNLVTTLHTDAYGYTWHIMQREYGSACLYYTVPGSANHHVVFDSADKGDTIPPIGHQALDEALQRAKAVVSACNVFAS